MFCRAYRQQAQRDGANELGDGDGTGHGGGVVKRNQSKWSCTVVFGRDAMKIEGLAWLKLSPR